MALVLLVASGLMARSFQALRSVDPGFRDPGEVQTFRLEVPEGVVADPDQAVRTIQQIAEAVGRLPGVTSVGVSTSITMDGYDSNDPVFVEGITPENGPMPPMRRYKWLGAGYVETMRNTLVAGRLLTWEDALLRRNVAMVSEALAREYFPTPAAAVGRRIRNSPSGSWREIVGVVGDDRDNGVAKAPTPIAYWPLIMDKFWTDGTFVQRNVAFAVRSARIDAPGFMSEVQRAVWSVNPNLPLAGVRSLDEIRAGSMAQTSFTLTMLAIAGSVALLLGLVGIYGVVAYIAAQRTREIGVRMALGARAADIRTLFLSHGLKLVAAGVIVGLGGAALLTSTMTTLFYGVAALDLPTYAAVATGLGAVTLVATWLPARRAARVDPIAALRNDA
jgi:predicted permease